MGKGGEQVVKAAEFKPPADAVIPTKKELRDAIPAHCFKHSVPYSLALVVRDAMVIGTFGALAWNFLPSENLSVLDWALWGVYGFWQGAAFTGWWVLAHECGHGGFSNYSWLNDAVGWPLHSFLLVPYFSWQYSHAKHHAKTNSLMDGETHNANTKQEMVESGYVKFVHCLGEDAFAVWQLVSHLVFGWPAYLVFNLTGARRLHNKQPIGNHLLDHFRPNSKLFPAGWENRVALSTFGVVLTFAGLFAAGQEYGHAKISLMYWPAYMWCNFWLVLYTWLQHTKEDVPQYGESEWTWMKGALCTIDRPYAECFGFFDWMHHRIGSTHVAHHLFSNLPCYHAQEATAALKAFLEPRGLYNYDGRPTLVAMWVTTKNCQYVDDITGVQYFKSIAAEIPKDGAAKGVKAE